jgi:ATP-dependent protease ClpP protease subunit
LPALSFANAGGKVSVVRRIQIVCCLFFIATCAWAGAYEDGVAAYDQGRFEVALALWLPLAESGLAAAQFNVGVLFEKGQGVTQNYAEAARWYIKAAEQGDAEAQYDVALLFERGAGVPPDQERARYWYEKVLANPRADRGTLQTKLNARQRLAKLTPPEEVIPFEGGRYLLRRSASGECIVAFQGIVSRDAILKLDGIVTRAAADGCGKPMTMLLESEGGGLFEGISLGQEVHSQGFRTVARYDCASACAMIFLGGAERILAGSRARIGFHQAAFIGGRGSRRCDKSMDSLGVVKMRKYLRFVIPADADRIYQLIMKTSCDSIEWVYGPQALEQGVATALESADVDVFGPESWR